MSRKTHSAAPILLSPLSLSQAQLIAQSIGQSFSVAYQEFLRANGIDPEDLSQREYSDLLNTQDMYNDDLIHFSKSENCKDVSEAAGDSPGGHRSFYSSVIFTFDFQTECHRMFHITYWLTFSVCDYCS